MQALNSSLSFRDIDYQLFKATLRNYLLSALNNGYDFQPYGLPADSSFDIDVEHPKSAADFTGNNGRITIKGPLSAAPSPTGQLSASTFQLTCWANSEPDAGYLGQAVTTAITHWRNDCMVMQGQAVSAMQCDQYFGPVFYPSNELYYSVVQVKVWISANCC